MNAPKNETIKGCTLELEGKNDIGNLHNYFREYRAVAKTMSGWRRVLASLGVCANVMARFKPSVCFSRLLLIKNHCPFFTGPAIKSLRSIQFRSIIAYSAIKRADWWKVASFKAHCYSWELIEAFETASDNEQKDR